VESNAEGLHPRADGERAQGCSVVGLELAHRAVVEVSGPDVGTVKSDAIGQVSHGKAGCCVGLVPVQQRHLEWVGCWCARRSQPTGLAGGRLRPCHRCSKKQRNSYQPSKYEDSTLHDFLPPKGSAQENSTTG